MLNHINVARKFRRIVSSAATCQMMVVIVNVNRPNAFNKSTENSVYIQVNNNGTYKVVAALFNPKQANFFSHYFEVLNSELTY